MDIAQLKLLAGRVRCALESSHVTIGHNQSLDVVASLAGLQNWPEVNAFPERVQACIVNQTSVARLATRLERKHGVKLSIADLLQALEGDSASASEMTRRPGRYGLLEVWPSGPQPGVYVTTSQEAINALLERYDLATDGAVLYAEKAGSHADNSIDLGEYGLSSSGLSKVASGTLLVIGPLVMTQRDWEETSEKLDWACLRADDGFRVAVLLESERPEHLHHDVEVAVRNISPDESYCGHALAGDVTEDGRLVSRTPFTPKIPEPIQSKVTIDTSALPERVREPLAKRLRERSTGVLILGSSEITEHRAIDQVQAALGLSAFLGPAARIKPRNRSTPSKDWDVPEHIKALPFLASVASAYSLGYRRMVLDGAYTDFDDLLPYFDEVLFIVGATGHGVEDAFFHTMRLGSLKDDSPVFEHFVGFAVVAQVQGVDGPEAVWDMFLPEDGWVEELGRSKGITARMDTLKDRRQIRWEDDIGELIALGKVDAEAVESDDDAHLPMSRRRHRVLQSYLEQLKSDTSN